MLQVYLLSVICPAICGWMLFKGSDDAVSFEPVFSFQGKEISLRFAAGIASIITGVLALLSPVEGDLPIIGDILPAVASVVSALALIGDYFYPKEMSGSRDEAKPGIFILLAAHSKPVGIASMIIAALHFLMPKALFL